MTGIKDGDIRLLLVDDEDGFRQTVAKRLGKRGLTAAQACSGNECMAILENSPMDVVVLDIRMPGMDGIETLKAIQEKYEDTQVVLLTGNVDGQTGAEGLKMGAFDFLTKPVNISHLAKKIRQAFALVRLEQETIKDHDYMEKLEQKMVDTERLAALGTLSTGIAHEINNPLAIINEASGFMKEVLASKEMANIPRKDALELGLDKIISSVARARRVTHQLLDYGKKQGAVISNVDMVTLTHDTLGLLRKEIREKNVQVNWDLEKEENLICTDPYQVRQVLINILTNAIHALDDSGTVTIRMRQGKTFFVLEVEDNGIGIPQNHLAQIFDPFFTTKTFNEGSGLGLFVVHKIVTGLEGTIDISSEKGKGTYVRIRLPIQGPKQDQYPNPQNQGKKT